jgi:hypothetical protein
MYAAYRPSVVAAYANDAYLRDAYRCLQVSHRGLWKPNCGGSGSGQNLLGIITLGGHSRENAAEVCAEEHARVLLIILNLGWADRNHP